MPMPDLKRAIAFRSVALNTVTESNTGGRTIIIGNKVTSFDPSDVQIRQFTEPQALVDGIDVGGVWLGARVLRMRGQCYDKTRGECSDRLAAIETKMLPESGTFGYYDLTFYKVAGASSTATLVTVSVRPNGLRFVADHSKAGGADGDPWVIEWAVDFYAKDPAFT
jgi:hypothetical protein